MGKRMRRQSPPPLQLPPSDCREPCDDIVGRGNKKTTARKCEWGVAGLNSLFVLARWDTGLPSSNVWGAHSSLKWQASPLFPLPAGQCDRLEGFQMTRHTATNPCDHKR